MLDSAYPVWYPFYGSWLIALTLEIVATVLSIVYQWPKNTVDIVELGLAGLRMILLVLLLSCIFGRRCSGLRYTLNDEENQPLQKSGHTQDCYEGSGKTQSGTRYGSISTRNGGDLAAAEPVEDDEEPVEDDDEAKESEMDRKARKRVEDRLKNDGNWWTYVKGFSVSC